MSEPLTDEEWKAALILFWRPHFFKGSANRTGLRYCIRGKDHRCHYHGLVFDTQSIEIGIKKVIAELPEPLNTWTFPVRQSPGPIEGLGECRANELLTDRAFNRQQQQQKWWKEPLFK